jgi:hypothetical protein
MMGTGSRGRLKSKTQGQTSFSPAIFANLLLILAGYRMKRPVTEVMLFPDRNRQYEMTPSLVKRGFTCHT